MCNISGTIFSVKNVQQKEVVNKKIIEIGSHDVNGGIRSVLESWRPESYVGIDIENGKGVDIVCSVENVKRHFKEGSFDIVISTEVIEHVENWAMAISHMKYLCKEGGIILITTRSYGFPYHAYPHDFWRYEENDMRTIFSDCDIESIEKDHIEPGIFIRVKKPYNFRENDLKNLELYSIISHRRTDVVQKKDYKTIRHFLDIVQYKLIDFAMKIGRKMINNKKQ